MNLKKVIYSLFQEAQNKNGVQYLFALLRVGPIESYAEDPLLTFNSKVFEGRVTSKDIVEAKDFWAMITNLSRIAGGYNYNPYIFWAAESGNFIEESKKLVAKDLAEILERILNPSQQYLCQQYHFLLLNSFPVAIDYFSSMKGFFWENV